MKSIFNFFIFICIISWTNHVGAQDIESNYSKEINNLINKESASIQIKELNNVKTSNNFSSNINMVQITQTGNLNITDVTVKSSSANMTINQNGSGNFLEVYKDAKQINQSIVQSGKNNFISDISNYYDKPIDMSINHSGSNLEFISSGTNSISKDLKISQSGNSGSIYIFNR
jgi:hypothetical protein